MLKTLISENITIIFVRFLINGAEDLKKFTESNITAVNIVFTPGEDFQNLRSRAAFNPVASRIAQAATLKAEKAGKGTVDLDAAKGKTPASTNENNPSL